MPRYVITKFHPVAPHNLDPSASYATREEAEAALADFHQTGGTGGEIHDVPDTNEQSEIATE
jgi:hypothetical protein